MANLKLGRPTKERLALVRSQVTDLLWNGKIETTEVRAKSVRSKAEKLLTLAINSYKDVVTKTVEEKNTKGATISKDVIIDGPAKLHARRQIMSFVYDRQEVRKEKEAKKDFVARTEDIKNPLIEKIFNVYAPKYAERAEKLGQGGGYTRVYKLGKRRGDNAEIVLIELI